MKQVSIIIPHYNSPVRLRRLLDSIPDREEIQVIVVDDISTEQTEEYERVTEAYKDRVEFYSNTPENKSAGGARNVGLEHASGKWLLFADADDYFLDNLWEKLSKEIDSDSDIVYFVPQSIIEGTALNSDRHITLGYYASYYVLADAKDKSDAETQLRMRWVVPWSKLIKRSLIEENNIRFDVVKYSNDLMFSAKTGFLAKKISVSDQMIYCFVKGENTLTHNTDPNMKAMRQEVYNRYTEYCVSHMPPKQARKYVSLQKKNRLRKKITGSKLLVPVYSAYRKIKY